MTWYDCGDAGYKKAGRLDLEAEARIQAHEVFDRLWTCAPQDTRSDARRRAYAWLAFRLNLAPSDCHMALFNEHTCRRVITICRRADYETVRVWAEEFYDGPKQETDSD